MDVRASYINSTLSDLLGSVNVTSPLPSKTPSASRLMCFRDGCFYIWNSTDCNVLVIRPPDQFQVLQLTDTPLFDVQQLELSPTATRLCLSGERGMTVVELPRRSSKSGLFQGPGNDTFCSTIPIAQSFFMNPLAVLLKVSWFPCDSSQEEEEHLVALTNDNCLRVFKLRGANSGHKGRCSLEQTLSLTPNSSTGDILFGGTPLSIRASLGESAVDFAFGPPTVQVRPGDTADSLQHQCPVFVLHGNGNVFCLLLGLGPHKPRHHQVMGPLPMYPDAEDNYSSEMCSILCVHPLISSPPVLVLATKQGLLYHAILLHSSGSVDDHDQDASGWSASLFGDATSTNSVTNGGGAELSLYVFECVQLDLALTDSSAMQRSPFDSPLLLHADPSTPVRYLCSHIAGVVSVSMPIVTELANPNSEDVWTQPQDSVVQHLISTQLSLKNRPNPVLGVAVTNMPMALACLLSDYSVLLCHLSSVAHLELDPLLLTDRAMPEQELRTKAVADRVPLDKHVAKLLQRQVSQPMLKLGQDVSGQDVLRLATHTIMLMRTEYLARQEAVMETLQKRDSYLRSHSKRMLKKLLDLKQEKEVLKNNAARLSERYEDLMDNYGRMEKRLEKVMFTLQSDLPYCSDAELKMQLNLSSMQARMKALANAVEQLQLRREQQMRQIHHRRMLSAGGEERSPSSTADAFSPEQLREIKAVLKDDGEQIQSMMQTIKCCKRGL